MLAAQFVTDKQIASLREKYATDFQEEKRLESILKRVKVDNPEIAYKSLDAAALYTKKTPPPNNRPLYGQLDDFLLGYDKMLNTDPLAHEGTWLDLMCGRMTAIRQATRLGKKTVGVDLLDHRKITEKIEDKLHGNPTLVIGDVERYAPNGKFGLITCVYGLNYLDNPLGLIERAYTWLEEGAMAAFNIPISQSPLGYSFSRSAEPYKTIDPFVEQLLEQGHEVEYASKNGSAFGSKSDHTSPISLKIRKTDKPLIFSYQEILPAIRPVYLL
jgi:hypothetical protein